MKIRHFWFPKTQAWLPRTRTWFPKYGHVSLQLEHDSLKQVHGSLKLKHSGLYLYTNFMHEVHMLANLILALLRLSAKIWRCPLAWISLATNRTKHQYSLAYARSMHIHLLLSTHQSVPSTPGKILLRHSTIHIQSHVSSLSWKGKVVSVTPLMVCANNLWDVAILLVRPHRRDPPPSWLPRTQAWVLNTQACLPKNRAWLPKTRVQFSSVQWFC